MIMTWEGTLIKTTALSITQEELTIIMMMMVIMNHSNHLMMAISKQNISTTGQRALVEAS